MDIPKEWKDSRVKLLQEKLHQEVSRIKELATNHDNKCDMQTMYADGEAKDMDRR